MKIFVVRIGEKYGVEYENYLNNKLDNYEIVWIRNAFHPEIKLQWNKMFSMSLSLEEPICVMDIDVELINDYKKIFDYPIERGQFLTAPGYWREPFQSKKTRKINGGFYKYYPVDCKDIYKKFMRNYKKWQSHWSSPGIVSGEQWFVEENVKEKLNLITLPNEWFTRYDKNKDKFYNDVYTFNTKNDYLTSDEKFHPDIKFIHLEHVTNYA